MGKFFISAFIVAGLMAFEPNVLAAEETEPTQGTSSTVTAPNEVMVEGQVTAIEGDTLRIKDKSGYDHSFKVTDPSMLDEFKSGDNVEILIQSPEAMESSPVPTPKTMESSPVPTPPGLRQRLKKYVP